MPALKADRISVRDIFQLVTLKSPPEISIRAEINQQGRGWPKEYDQSI